MTAYLSWSLNIAASTGVFTAAVVWGLLDLRRRNIWAGYVSHVLADAAVFGIGYRLMTS